MVIKELMYKQLEATLDIGKVLSARFVF